MGASEHRETSPGSQEIAVALVTVSDTRDGGNDWSGNEAGGLITNAGFVLRQRHMVPDDVTAIRSVTTTLIDRGDLAAILFTGGTGFSPRDVTPEALEPLFERRIDGFAELFRALSFAEVGAAAMLSRACAGIVSGVAVFLMPGSPAAVRLALDRLILPELRHLVGQMRRSPVREISHRQAGSEV